MHDAGRRRSTGVRSPRLWHEGVSGPQAAHPTIRLHMFPTKKNARSSKLGQPVLSSLGSRELRLMARAVQNETKEATAWHEAGHAVVGARLGMTLHKVEIRVRIMTDSYGEVSISTG